ncbi:GNAT family N-acetyltransferase [Ectothiorhodospiraceae bacterium WFHF3C12]|nr:GNAT family N-acetyltransferase [Ectothiorhodospiraceae bacterium WFHF3C12]
MDIATEYRSHPGQGRSRTVPRALAALRAVRSRGRVIVRSLDARHHADIEAFYTGLSPQTLSRRFHTPCTVLRPYQLRFALSMDGTEHIALGAFRDGELVGDGRLVRVRSDAPTAEIAVTVADGAQGHGVGARLLHRIGERARREGVTHLVYTIQTDNDAAVRLFAARGRTQSRGSGQLTGVIDVAALAGSQSPYRAGPIAARPGTSINPTTEILK